jgi:death-on-curing protein
VPENSSEPRWVSRLVVDAIQTDTLLTHGGLPGLRDADLLESALARPRQRLAYEPATDLAALAALHRLKRGPSPPSGGTQLMLA